MDNGDGTLTHEEIERMIKENENVFILKDKLAEVLHGHPSQECFLALRMMIVQFLCDSCNSKDDAIEMVAGITGASIMIINGMDEMGACAWNYKDQTLQ